MAIQDFTNPKIRTFFVEGRVPRKAGWAKVARIALRRLDMLDYANSLKDLSALPGSRLKRLQGRMTGHHSIRVNEQWRIVFRWTELGPTDVDIVDYH